ncbi:MAG: phenylalanine--tRNA ligase subunit beta [Flavobacteriales bacterium]|nr:MAG: phenylalanine--tRNA ligase subunit beta [Flavobacteriales bacterium]
MKISIDWLKSILPTTASPQEISDLLSVSGLEVEKIEPWFSAPKGMKGFVIGEVLHCAPHPNADRLRITTVDIGGPAPLPIVCGAANVAAKQKVVVALVGTEIELPGKEPFTIGKAKIRGEVSEGMICASDECGMGDSHEGILVLPENATVGMSASAYFGIISDSVLEIGLTANRGDAASHIGVANDLAALLQLPFQRIVKKALPTLPTGRKITISEDLLCGRYTAIEIENIQLGESPQSTCNRLRAIGVEPRNNVVDATNYILHHTGQPAHAFDADLVHGNIAVRLALEGETLTVLDGRILKLHPSDIVIADEKKIVALGGLMGGLNSAIGPKTKNILLEIAHFNATNIRKSAKRHAIHTDSGFRFERGIDQQNLHQAASLLVEQVINAAGGTATKLSEWYPIPYKQREILLDIHSLNSFVGHEIDEKTTIRILTQLGFETQQKESSLLVVVPSWRNDVEQVVDLYEEVMRIYGYDQIPMSGKLQASLGTFEGIKTPKVEHKLREYLSNQGLFEALTNSLHASHWYPDTPDLIRLSNPLSSDMDVMRASIIPGLLQSVAYNINRKIQSVQLFELGLIYEKIESGFKETPTLSMVFWGTTQPESWESKSVAIDVYYIKRIVQGLLLRIGSKKSVDTIAIYPASQILLKANKIPGTVWCVEIPWRTFINKKADTIAVTQAAKFPVMRRDLSLVLEKDIDFHTLKNIVDSAKISILTDTRVFDIFEGKPLADGQKAVALSFHFSNPFATLTDAETDTAMNQLMQAFESMGAIIRK